MSARTCWEDGPRGDEGDWFSPRPVGSTCLLPDGHDGDHVFTPDDQITIQLISDPSPGSDDSVAPTAALSPGVVAVSSPAAATPKNAGEP